MSYQPKIILSQLHYRLSNQRTIFSDLDLVFPNQKTAMVGKNGVGKTTLFQLILQKLQPTSGLIKIDGTLDYCPQNFESFLDKTVAEVFEVQEKWVALEHISEGSIDLKDFEILNDDWDIQNRIENILKSFNLLNIPLNRKLNTLSGGEVTRIFLAKLFFKSPDFILLDEPTNNLDRDSRNLLYQTIEAWNKGLVVISHDRTLLNLMDSIIEMTPKGVELYSGNYDFYCEQRTIKKETHLRQFHDAKKSLQNIQQQIQKTRQAWAQRKAKGKQKRKNRDQPKMFLDAQKDRSGRTLKTLNIREKQLLEKAEERLEVSKNNVITEHEIKVDLPKTYVPSHKFILSFDRVTFYYDSCQPLIRNFDIAITGPKRMAVIGKNGSGKTTLVKLLLGQVKPISGQIKVGTNRIRYLDQHIDLLEPQLTILENYMKLNPDILERDARFHLSHFLFRSQDALKKVQNLSGGERLRAALCCVLTAHIPPQLLILDEPTNHLDLESMEALESALNCYQGALIVISHDEIFLENIKIENCYEMS